MAKLNKPAILVVDMLNDFVYGALTCDRGKAIVPAFVFSFSFLSFRMKVLSLYNIFYHKKEKMSICLNRKIQII